MINIFLPFFEIVFLISLIFASISSIKVWLISKKLTNKLKKILPEGYTTEFFDIQSKNKYKDLNLQLQKIINMYEDNLPTEKIAKEMENLKSNFKFSKEFIDKLKEIFKEYNQNVYKWKKFGKISGYIALISGAISFITYYLVK